MSPTVKKKKTIPSAYEIRSSTLNKATSQYTVSHGQHNKNNIISTLFL